MEFLRFTGVNEVAFEGDLCNSSDSVIIHSISASDSTTRILVVKITTQEHARASRAFGENPFGVLRPLGLEDSLRGFGGAKIYGDGQTKVPDEGWGPIDRPPYQSQQWPSLLVEVAVPESRTKLQADVTFWLTRSYGQITTAISLGRSRMQEIRISKWVRDSNDQPRCDQVVTIKKRSLQDKASVVGNGP